MNVDDASRQVAKDDGDFGMSEETGVEAASKAKPNTFEHIYYVFFISTYYVILQCISLLHFTITFAIYSTNI